MSVLVNAVIVLGFQVSPALGQTPTEESWFGLDETSPVAQDSADWRFDWGLRGGGGFFNFRNSLFSDVPPGQPDDLADEWFEGFIKGWTSFERDLGGGEFFGEVSYAVAANGRHTAQLVGGDANSSDLDALYLGWRRGRPATGRFEIRAGRTPYVHAQQFLLADGYQDGGSRGGYWSNARTAWAPGVVTRYARDPWEIEAFWLGRDERPEADTDTDVGGVDLAWRSRGQVLELGAAWLTLAANARAPQRDGAEVFNLRAYWKPVELPLVVSSEWVHQSNGLALDAQAAYLQADWTFEETAWQWNLTYRYAWFEGDDPQTPANENYDPLFPGFLDWGTWWQGEIAGEYFLSNSNLSTHMLKLRIQPLPSLTTGWVWFDYTVHRPGSFEGGITSDALGTEIDWYLDYQFNEFMSISVVLAETDPGPAAEQAFDRTSNLRIAFAYLNFRY